jgi:DNA-binding transcriptional ArsR family regulator
MEGVPIELLVPITSSLRPDKKYQELVQSAKGLDGIEIGECKYDNRRGKIYGPSYIRDVHNRRLLVSQINLAKGQAKHNGFFVPVGKVIRIDGGNFHSVPVSLVKKLTPYDNKKGGEVMEEIDMNGVNEVPETEEQQPQQTQAAPEVVSVEQLKQQVAPVYVGARKDVLAFLREHKGKAFTVKHIAQQCGISQMYARQKLMMLADRGLVKRARLPGVRAIYYFVE